MYDAMHIAHRHKEVCCSLMCVTQKHFHTHKPVNHLAVYQMSHSPRSMMIQQECTLFICAADVCTMSSLAIIYNPFEWGFAKKVSHDYQRRTQWSLAGVYYLVLRVVFVQIRSIETMI